jgi:hypothetical protein
MILNEEGEWLLKKAFVAYSRHCQKEVRKTTKNTLAASSGSQNGWRVEPGNSHDFGET